MKNSVLILSSLVIVFGLNIIYASNKKDKPKVVRKVDQSYVDWISNVLLEKKGNEVSRTTYKLNGILLSNINIIFDDLSSYNVFYDSFFKSLNEYVEKGTKKWTKDRKAIFEKCIFISSRKGMIEFDSYYKNIYTGITKINKLNELIYRKQLIRSVHQYMFQYSLVVEKDFIRSNVLKKLKRREIYLNKKN